MQSNQVENVMVQQTVLAARMEKVGSKLIAQAVKQGHAEDMATACLQAIVGNVFYNAEFDKFVEEKLGGFGEAQFAGEVFINYTMTCVQSGKEREELRAKIEAQPYGFYGLIVDEYDDRSMHFKVIVSDGKGGLHSGTRYDGFSEAPTGKDIMLRIKSREIYDCRKLLENLISMDAAVEAIDVFGFRVGMVLKNFKISWDTFSTGEVVEIDRERGEVKLSLKKRGSRNRWEAWMPANTLANRVNLQPVQREAESEFALC